MLHSNGIRRQTPAMSYAFTPLNKHPRGKPSRYRSTFSFLGSGVLTRKFFIYTPQGARNKTPRDSRRYDWMTFCRGLYQLPMTTLLSIRHGQAEAMFSASHPQSPHSLQNFIGNLIRCAPIYLY